MPTCRGQEGSLAATVMKKEELTTAALYAAHWQYVYHLLPSYGIPLGRRWDAAQDLAQTVWLTVLERLPTYSPELHKTPRAWLTGIVRRCAANHRRKLQRRREDLVQDAAELVLQPGLDPEQSAMLATLDQAVRNPERYEAFLLRYRHGLSITEIAAVTGATESAVEWRIRMAKKELERADETDEANEADEIKKSRAFLGLGSLEALSDALQPKPLPPEMGQELWDRLAPHMGGSAGPSPSHPPRAPAGGVVLAKGALVALLVGAFLMGGATGVGGLLAWQRSRSGARAVVEETPAGLAPGAAVSNAPLAVAVAQESGPAEASSSAPAAPSLPWAPSTRSDTGSSKRLLLQMRRASQAGNFALVLALADEHARDFPALDVTARERERAEARRRMSQR